MRAVALLLLAGVSLPVHAAEPCPGGDSILMCGETYRHKLHRHLHGRDDTDPYRDLADYDRQFPEDKDFDPRDYPKKKH